MTEKGSPPDESAGGNVIRFPLDRIGRSPDDPEMAETALAYERLGTLSSAPAYKTGLVHKIGEILKGHPEIVEQFTGADSSKGPDDWTGEALNQAKNMAAEAHDAARLEALYFVDHLYQACRSLHLPRTDIMVQDLISRILAQEKQ